MGENSSVLFFLSDYFILGLRVFDRVLFEEGFDLFGSSVVGLSATKEDVEG